MNITLYDAFGVKKLEAVGARRSYASHNHISGGGGLENWPVAGMINGTALTTASIVADTLYAMPFSSPRGGTIDQMTINVTTLGGGSSTRVGLYKSTLKAGNLYPGARITEAGTISTASTGVKTYTGGLPVTLDSDELYWFVCLCNTTAPILRGLAVAGCYPIFGTSSVFGTAPGLGISVAFAFGTMPDPFTAGGAVITAAPIPAIACRYSA